MLLVPGGEWCLRRSHCLETSQSMHVLVSIGEAGQLSDGTLCAHRLRGVGRADANVRSQRVRQGRCRRLHHQQDVGEPVWRAADLLEPGGVGHGRRPVMALV